MAYTVCILTAGGLIVKADGQVLDLNGNVLAEPRDTDSNSNASGLGVGTHETFTGAVIAAGEMHRATGFQIALRGEIPDGSTEPLILIE